MIAYIQVQPTNREYTYRVFLTNHTDTLRITELYFYNKGMDGDHYPDYMSEHEIISQFIGGITTMTDLLSQVRADSRKWNEDLHDFVYGKGWTANFQISNNVLKYLGIEGLQFPDEDQELPEPPAEIEVETDKGSDPIGDSGPGPGELLIIPPDIGVDSKPWGEWVRDTCADCFAYARHFNKPVYLCDDDGSMGPICNLDLAYKFKNLSDNPNLLNSCPEAFEELRAGLGVSYFFENKNKTSE